jgi:hypothetical protein
MANEPVKSDTKEGTVQQETPASRFHRYMLNRATQNRSSRRADVMDGQITKILAASTADEIWDADAGGAIQGRDLIGLEVQINTFDSVLSTKTFEGGSSRGYYAQMDAVCLGGPADVMRRTGLTVGQDFILQTGADLFYTKIRAFEAADELPVRGVIIGIETAGGYLLKFGRLPERTNSGTAQ